LFVVGCSERGDVQQTDRERQARADMRGSYTLIYLL
jgi:hypothetical protein